MPAMQFRTSCSTCPSAWRPMKLIERNAVTRTSQSEPASISSTKTDPYTKLANIHPCVVPSATTGFFPVPTPHHRTYTLARGATCDTVWNRRHSRCFLRGSSAGTWRVLRICAESMTLSLCWAADSAGAWSILRNATPHHVHERIHTASICFVALNHGVWRLPARREFLRSFVTRTKLGSGLWRREVLQAMASTSASACLSTCQGGTTGAGRSL